MHDGALPTFALAIQGVIVVCTESFRGGGIPDGQSQEIFQSHNRNLYSGVDLLG